MLVPQFPKCYFLIKDKKFKVDKVDFHTLESLTTLHACAISSEVTLLTLYDIKHIAYNFIVIKRFFAVVNINK